jgi:hypothetical protein
MVHHAVKRRKKRETADKKEVEGRKAKGKSQDKAKALNY